MTITGGKRKINKSLKAWVTFVKKVQKEEKLSYKDAIHRAKQRKDKGEKWMSGGNVDPTGMFEARPSRGSNPEPEPEPETTPGPEQEPTMGGRRRRRTMRRSRGMSRGRGRSRSRASRRH